VVTTSGSNLRKYVRDVVLASGGLIDDVDSDAMNIMLPEDLAKKARLSEFMTVCFDYETQREYPESLFVTFGSPVLESLVDMGMAMGRCVRQYVSVPATRVPSNITGRINSKVTFDRSKSPLLRTAGVEAHEVLVFRYIVFYISDDKFSENMEIAVDTVTMADDTPFLLDVKSLSLPEDLYGLSEMATQGSGFASSGSSARDGVVARSDKDAYDQALEVALRNLKERISVRLRDYQKLMDLYCHEELTKVLAFYEENVRDLEKRLDRAGEDEEKKRKLRAKIQAALVEKGRRVQDLLEKYRVQVEVRLDSVVSVLVPKVKAVLDIQHKNEKYSQVVYYNLAANEVELPVCPACGRTFSVGYPSTRLRGFVCSPKEA